MTKAKAIPHIQATFSIICQWRWRWWCEKSKSISFLYHKKSSWFWTHFSGIKRFYNVFHLPSATIRSWSVTSIVHLVHHVWHLLNVSSLSVTSSFKYFRFKCRIIFSCQTCFIMLKWHICTFLGFIWERKMQNICHHHIIIIIFTTTIIIIIMKQLNHLKISANGVGDPLSTFCLLVAER